MKQAIQTFYREPIVFLGSLMLIAQILVDQNILASFVGLIVIGVCTLIQRQLVSPVNGPVENEYAGTDD